MSTYRLVGSVSFLSSSTYAGALPGGHGPTLGGRFLGGATATAREMSVKVRVCRDVWIVCLFVCFFRQKHVGKKKVDMFWVGVLLEESIINYLDWFQPWMKIYHLLFKITIFQPAMLVSWRVPLKIDGKGRWSTCPLGPESWKIFVQVQTCS